MAYDYNKIIKHVDFGNNNSTLSNTTQGSCFFSGSNYFTSGYDYVGLQLGNDVDKWQITITDYLKWRKNNYGGSDSSHWSGWRTIIDSSNQVNYSVSSGTQYQDNKIYKYSFPLIDLTSNPQSSYTIIPNKLYSLNVDNTSNVQITLLHPSDYEYKESYDSYDNTTIYNSMEYKVMFDKSSSSSNTSIKFTISDAGLIWESNLENTNTLNCHYEITIIYDGNGKLYGISNHWYLN